MTTTGADGQRRRVVPRGVRLDAEELCRGRFVPDPAVPLPTEVVVYDVEPDTMMSWGEPVSVSATEERAWADARLALLEALSRALELLFRAHGGREVEVRAVGGRTWEPLRAPRPWPGWRRRAAERSTSAQRAFLDRVAAAEQAYRPVRERIERRVEATRAEDERRLDELRQQSVERHRRLTEVADRPVWALVDTGDVHYAYRVDVPPGEPVPDGTATPGEPMTAVQLDCALVGPRFRRNQRCITWDRAACAAVERECSTPGWPVAFGRWWDTVSTGTFWRTALESGTWVTRAAPPRHDVRASHQHTNAHVHVQSYSGTIHVSGTF